MEGGGEKGKRLPANLTILENAPRRTGDGFKHCKCKIAQICAADELSSEDPCASSSLLHHLDILGGSPRFDPKPSVILLIC